VKDARARFAQRETSRYLNDLILVVLCPFVLGALAVGGDTRGIKHFLNTAVKCTACVLAVAASRLDTRKSSRKFMVTRLTSLRLLPATFGISLFLGAERYVSLSALIARRLLGWARTFERSATAAAALLATDASRGTAAQEVRLRPIALSLA
jgi:hypothetical protein